MNTLNFKQAYTKTYAVRGYNVDLTFVYDANGVYIEQKTLIEQMPDIPIAKNKFKHLNTKYSLTINRSEVKGNKQLLSLFAGTRQNQRRLNSIEGTILVLKRFNLPLADKMIKTIEQRKANIEKLQAKLVGSKYGLDFKKIDDSTHERTKEIKPMIVDSTELKKMAKGKVKQAQDEDYKLINYKYKNIKKAYEDEHKSLKVLSAKHNKLRDKYNQVDNENARLFKKLGQAETDMKAYDDLKIKYDLLKKHFEDLDALYHENYNDLVNVKNANFGKRLAAVFTGWGV